ncbi:MAG TPA: LpqB family beta-propeller domain-containing protein [Gemmatimonas sp.]|nr:LpqB family beta-propeller domain-containing protein [Gemmatimonas sp.]
MEFSGHDRLRTALADRYRVERELGAGGMATVYLAHDLRHERDVAIKVLHPDLGAALGGDRFLSEIRTTARLQHPHILPLLDSGAADGLLYYVMPLVRGETLRARLDRERQLPIDDAVRIAREVASALEHAHKQGVIHRDIKPENILLQDGAAVVADFGIALAVQQAGGARMTQTGLSLGTPQYMSPEQATGERVIDARSDVYALAAVTYEMLAGEPPFTGPSVQAIVSRLMTEEPRALTVQRRAVPPGVEAAVLRGLEKLPADRFATAGDFGTALDMRTTTVSAGVRATNRPGLRWLIGALAATTLVCASLAAWSLTRVRAAREVVRYRLVADSVSAERTWTGDVNISPDGTLITRRGGPGERILVRRRDALGFTVLDGTEGAMGVVFSPDGSRLAFYQEGRLATMPVGGGQLTIIADSMISPETVAWSSDGRIYRGSPRGALTITRCPETDCTRPEPFSVLDTAVGEMTHMHADVSVDGSAVLFQAEFVNGTRTIMYQRADARTHRTVTNGVRARFVGRTHLLYTTTDGKLWVAPFDAKEGTLTGEPRLVAENLPQSVIGAVDFAVSATGTLLFSEERGGAERELVWVTRDGQATPFDSTWRAAFSSPTLSRDGQKLAVAIREGSRSSIWTRRTGGQPIRLTTGQNASEPAWSPDGRVVTFLAAADRSNTGNVWRQPVDGGDVARLMVRSVRPLSEQVWLPDGSGLVMRTTTASPGAGDLVATSSLADSLATPLLSTPSSEYSPAISPDGQWLAFSSNVSGRFEVYVAPRANPQAARVLVSSGGGSSPRWAPDGRALYYLNTMSELIEARLVTTPFLRVDATRPLIDARSYVQTSLSRRSYDVAPDGRFLFIRRAGNAEAGSMVVVEHWAHELDASRKR